MSTRNYVTNPASGGEVFSGEADAGNVITPRMRTMVGVDGNLAVGLTPFKRVSSADTNNVNIKNAAGIIGAISAMNACSAIRYLKLYDMNAAPIVGSNTPVQSYMLPGNANGAGMVLAIPNGGLLFSAGISMGITTGIADSSNAAVGANEVVVNIGYQ